jgi:hypothetical protein
MEEACARSAIKGRHYIFILKKRGATNEVASQPFEPFDRPVIKGLEDFMQDIEINVN